jgi:hypothetical protein
MPFGHPRRPKPRSFGGAYWDVELRKAGWARRNAFSPQLCLCPAKTCCCARRRGLTHETLKELGVTAVGHRLKLLDAIAALRTAKAQRIFERFVKKRPRVEADNSAANSGVAVVASSGQLTLNPNA